MNILKNWLAARRRKQADIHFRTGYLYAMDRRLFRDGRQLLSQNDLVKAMQDPAFAAGHSAGHAHRFEVSAMHLAEAERRSACDQI